MGAILNVLEQGVYSPKQLLFELKRLGVETTYNTVVSALQRLKQRGLVFQVSYGYYTARNPVLDAVSKIFDVDDPKKFLIDKLDWGEYPFLVFFYIMHILETSSNAYTISFARFRQFCERRFKIKVPENSAVQHLFWYLINLCLKKYIIEEGKGRYKSKQVLVDVSQLRKRLSFVLKADKPCLTRL